EATEALAIAFDAALAEPGGAVEIQRLLRRVAAGVEHERLAHQEVGARHVKIDAPFAAEPAREADMIGMETRYDEAGHRLAAETGLEDLAPERLHLVGGDAGIDNRPALAILDQPEVDVVELEGKRHAHPPDAGRGLDHFRRLRHPVERVAEIAAFYGRLGSIGHLNSRTGGLKEPCGMPIRDRRTARRGQTGLSPFQRDAGEMRCDQSAKMADSGTYKLSAPAVAGPRSPCTEGSTFAA